MNEDPIVQEVRAIREAYAEKFGFDLHAICEDLRREQRASGRKVVRLEPRRIPPEPDPVLSRR